MENNSQESVQKSKKLYRIIWSSMKLGKSGHGNWMQDKTEMLQDLNNLRNSTNYISYDYEEKEVDAST